MTGLFITGTDTGVGKTRLTAALARRLRSEGHRVGIYKPVCSGAEWDEQAAAWVWPDVVAHANALGGEFPDDWICPQRFPAPLAPHVAAEQAGQSIDVELLQTGVQVWDGQVDVLLVEGVGGWLCPLTPSSTIADLAKTRAFPVLIVSANRLGTINHTLLTVQAIAASNCRPVGVVLNNAAPEPDPSAGSNLDELSRFCPVPVGGPVPYGTATDLLLAPVFTSIKKWVGIGTPAQ